MTKAHLFNTSASISGLYAITPDEVDTERLCIKVEAALKGGVKLLQYRNKTAEPALREWQAAALFRLCRAHGATFIINDHVALCERLDADGVHLGVTDGDIAAARKRLGEAKIIGASCYNQLALAEQAAQQGATYVAFGACFASGTKPQAISAPLSLFTQAKKLNLPLVAIGGISLGNAAQIIQAGADAIAVVGALFDAPQISETSQQFTALWQSIHIS